MIKLKSLSPIIISPRDQFSWYKDLDFTLEDIKEKYSGIEENMNKINQIYPFYRYGEYDYLLKGTPYIPGSSIKGALKSTLNQSYMEGKFDDIEIEENSVEIINLYKIQNLNIKDQQDSVNLNNQISKIKRDIFMPNIAIEAIKANTDIELKDLNIDYYIGVNSIFQNRLENFINYINIIEKDNLKRGENENKDLSLDKVKEKIKKLKDKKILILGGYKGLINSLNNFEIKKEYESALYLDNTTNLPYGILEIIE